MSNGQTCSKCGATLTAFTTNGVCSACLLEAGLFPDVPVSAGLRLPLGDYELIEEIARGGMGVVYRARQLSLNRTVAVKMVLSGALAGEKALQRFRAEAEIAAGLQHPNIVRIHEVGEHEGQPFFSMDLVEGRSLAEIARHEPLPGRRAARYVKVVAEAVHYAHTRGVLHRDLKPSNILIDDSDQPRVTDFGLAKQLDAIHDITVTGLVLGSPNYMPPEQASGQHQKIGSASDVYSLGAILYHLITGRAPFMAESVPETLRQVAENDPVAPRLLNSSTLCDLETICLKCLEKEPARRYATAQEVTEELARFLADEPIQARPLNHLQKAARWCRRNPAVATLSALVISALVAVAIVSTVAAFRVNAARKREEEHRRLAEARELVARQHLYVVDMNLAQLAVQADDRQRALMLLERNRPKEGQDDLRNWEWRYLWRVCQGDELATLGYHSNEVDCLAASRKGNLVASGSYDRTINLWSISDRSHVRSLKPRSETYALAFSPDDRFLASAGQRIVKLWEVASGKEVAAIPCEGNPQSVAFSLDGSRLIYFSGQTIEVVDWSRRVKAATFKFRELETSKFDQLVHSPVDPLLAIGSHEGEVFLIDSETGAIKQRLQGLTNRVRSFSFSPDGNRLAAGGHDLLGVVWNVKSGAHVAAFAGHSRTVASVAFSPDGRLLGTASSDQTIRVWDAASGRELSKHFGHVGRVYAIAFTSGGRELVSGGADKSVKVWSPSPVDRPLQRLPQGVRSLALSPDGTIAACVMTNGQVMFIDALTMERRGALANNSAAIESVEFSPNGDSLVTGDCIGLVRLWHRGSNAPPRSFAMQHSAAIRGVRFSRDGRTICSWDGTNVLLRSDVLTGRITARMNVAHRAKAFALAPNLERVALGSEARVRVINLDTGMEIVSFSGHNRTVSAIGFSPDGRWLASASYDQTVRVWDIVQKRHIVTLRGHRSDVFSIEFSPDGKRLASGGAGGGVVKVWDVATWEEVSSFEIGGRTEQVFYSPDGSLFVAGMFDVLTESIDEWRIWRAPSLSEIARAEENVPTGAKRRRASSSDVTISDQSIRFLSVNHPSATSSLRLLDIPARHAATQLGAIDLGPWYNATLATPWLNGRFAACDLSILPIGRQMFGGVEFDVRGVLQLARSADEAKFPKVVTGIPLNRKGQTLHFLHAANENASTGTELGAYVIHYATGATNRIPIIYGDSLRFWWYEFAKPSTARRAAVAWTGTNDVTRARGVAMRLFHYRWTNPHPELVIKSLDFVSALNRSAPFVVAISVE